MTQTPDTSTEVPAKPKMLHGFPDALFDAAKAAAKAENPRITLREWLIRTVTRATT